MRPVWLIGLFTLWTALPARAQFQPPLPPLLQRARRLVCVGDSITQLGEKPGGYVWLLRVYLRELYPREKFVVINAGRGGDRSKDMLARFQKDVLSKKPDLVTINAGVNDVWHHYLFSRGILLEEYRRNIEAMVTQAKRAGAQVILLSPTIINEKLDTSGNARLQKYCQAMQEVARKYQVPYVDYQEPFRRIIAIYRETTGARDTLLTTDGVHMNESGNRIMAQGLLNALGIEPRYRRLAQDKVEFLRNQYSRNSHVAIGR